MCWLAYKSPRNGTHFPMSSRLDRVKDWSLFAKEARYCALNLARALDVSPRQLRRYFEIKNWGTPHNWLHKLRMRRAVELICDKTPVKDVWIELGYKEAAHFTHDFKMYFGVPPSKFTSDRLQPPAQAKNVPF